MKIAEAYNNYRDEQLITRGRSMSAIKQINHHRDSMIEFFGNIEIESITIEKATTYLRWLFEDRCNNTVRCYAGSLRQVLRNCLIHKLDVLNPELIPIPKKDSIKVEYVTANDVRAMLLRADSLRTKLIISMLYSSGVRVSELCSIKIKDIAGSRFTIKGKGNKIRICFIDKRTKDLMHAYLLSREDNCPYLFVDQKGEHKLTAITIQRTIRSVLKKAKINRHITPHSFRHGFATDLLDHGVAIQDVSQMLGHASVQTTMIYRHITDAGLMEKYKKAHSV